MPIISLSDVRNLRSHSPLLCAYFNVYPRTNYSINVYGHIIKIEQEFLTSNYNLFIHVNHVSGDDMECYLEIPDDTYIHFFGREEMSDDDIDMSKMNIAD